MYDVTALRNWLIGQLSSFTGATVVPNDEGKRPKKPFFAYTITSPYIPQAAPPAIEYSDAMPLWSRKQRTEYPTIVWSFTAVSDSMQECYEKILHLRRWFALDGRSALKDRDVVVARLEAAQDRTLILDETKVEYRAGFDVVLRVCSQIGIDIETIETVEINDEASLTNRTKS